MAARVGVTLFPGSNCEQDVIEVVRQLGGHAEILWHEDDDLDGADAVVIPGGFAHGDYLRTGALPGALHKNAGLKFKCGPAQVRVETSDSVLTSTSVVGETISIPINHFEGNFACAASTLAELRAEHRVVFRYVDNPNGSLDDIAGICNEGRNVVGLMPHPERACHPLLGSNDGEAR